MSVPLIWHTEPCGCSEVGKAGSASISVICTFHQRYPTADYEPQPVSLCDGTAHEPDTFDQDHDPDGVQLDRFYAAMHFAPDNDDTETREDGCMCDAKQGDPRCPVHDDDEDDWETEDPRR